MGHNCARENRDYKGSRRPVRRRGAALSAGSDGDIAATDIVGGGQETTITFDASALQRGGDYTYFCSFPGHFVLMYGKLIVE
jgi:azurin